MNRPEYIQELFQSYKTDPKLVKQDYEIIELVSNYHVGYSFAMKLMLNMQYRNQPDYMKFLPQCILDLDFIIHSSTHGFVDATCLDGVVVVGTHQFLCDITDASFDYPTYVSNY